MTNTTTDTAAQGTLPPPGQNIFAPCKKCGADRYHKVLAHTGDRKAKVECEVCHSKKTYTQPKPKKARVSRPKKAKAKNQGPELPSWETLQTSIGTGKVSNYRMTEAFQAQTAIQHPSFGVGFVTSVTPNKIEVVFKESVRLLVHNYKG